MKIKLLVATVAVTGFFSQSYAVINPSSDTLTSAIEILKLPHENRRLVLKKQGEKFYKNFVSVAFDENQSMNLRWKALMAVAEAGGVKATDDLVKAADHKQWYMRNAALIGLCEVNPEKCLELAKKLLKDKALVVRSAAVETLEKQLSPEIRDILWEELNQNYNFKNEQGLWIRKQIVGVLAKKPRDQELKIFVSLLSDKDLGVQLPAVHGLEKLTGVKLGEGSLKQSALVGLWKDYIKNEKIDL